MEATVTISLDQFKNLELHRDAFQNNMIIYQEPFGAIKSIHIDEVIKILNDNNRIDQLKKEVDYYRNKLENLPWWFKMLFPNSWH